MLTPYLRNIVSFDWIYGFDRLQSRITWFFDWFWWLVGDAVFTRAGPLNGSLDMEKMWWSLCVYYMYKPTISWHLLDRRYCQHKAVCSSQNLLLTLATDLLCPDIRELSFFTWRGVSVLVPHPSSLAPLEKNLTNPSDHPKRFCSPPQIDAHPHSH